MPHCAVIWCKNQSKNINKQNSGVSYHKFPKDPYIKDKWIQATGKYNWFPQKRDSICSVHFEAESFTKRNVKTYLSSDAIPILKLHPIFNEINVKHSPVEEANEDFEDISNKQSSRSSPQARHEATYLPNILDTPRRRKLKLSVIRAQQTIKRQSLNVKRLQEKNRRLSKKNAKMESTIKYLRERSAITDERRKRQK